VAVLGALTFAPQLGQKLVGSVMLNPQLVHIMGIYTSLKYYFSLETLYHIWQKVSIKNIVIWIFL
jgi:hypothetical protein